MGCRGHFGPQAEISGWNTERANAFLVYIICINETVHNKWCVHKSVWQTESGLERSFVEHWPNYV